MDQKEAGVCGQASLMTFFAKNTPSAFVEYAISLMRNGRGKLHNLTIEPAEHTVSGWGPRRGMPEADIVTMGSLGLSLVKFLEGASTSAVCKWLTDAGFRNVNDKVIALPGLSDQEKLRDSLVEAATAVSAKKLVIMAIDGDLVEYLKKAKLNLFGKSELSRTSGADFMGGIGATGLEARRNPLRGTDHWVLVTHIEVTRKGVTIIKLYSWGHSMQGKFKTDAFLTYYGGYIVAEPPPT